MHLDNILARQKISMEKAPRQLKFQDLPSLLTSNLTPRGMKMTDFNWNGLPTAILQLRHSKLNTKPSETRFGSRTKPKHTQLMQEKKSQCTQEHTRLLV